MTLLALMVLRRLAQRPDAAWVHRLQRFIADVRSASLAWSRQREFGYRRVVAVPKDRPGSGQKYRLLTLYDLREAAIANGFTGYLRERIDPTLSANCLAFRGRGKDGARPTHHDAIRRISEFSTSTGKKPMFVAECDIRGFFDGLRHSVVRRELKRVLSTGSHPDDKVLVEFSESLMSGYDFISAREKAVDVLGRERVRSPKIGEPQPGLARIGIPQGSSFSCVLANVVLRAADRAVERSPAYAGGLYVRYCDDIVVLHTRRASCARLLDEYLNALERLQLPAHPPQGFRTYGRAFWSGKSKRPYKWAADGRPKSVPWLAFVGYQLRRDGVIRVRPASIAKELRKQQQVADEIIGRLERMRVATGPVVSRRLEGIIHRARTHLLAFGVGYPAPFSLVSRPDALCWANGFEILRELPAVKSNIAPLDRGRGRALARLRARIRGLYSTGRLAQDTRPNEAEPGFIIRRLGWPLSYWRQFVGA